MNLPTDPLPGTYLLRNGQINFRLCLRKARQDRDLVRSMLRESDLYPRFYVRWQAMSLKQKTERYLQTIRQWVDDERGTHINPMYSPIKDPSEFYDSFEQWGAEQRMRRGM